MRVGLKRLVEANVDMVVGNHRVFRTLDGRNFIYHSTPICFVNDIKMSFRLTNGGYGTISTTQAMNQYRRYFSSIGYSETIEGGQADA